VKPSGLEHRVEIAGRILALASPGPAEALLDELAERSPSDRDVQDERLPYWADLWPSAVALATHLLVERPLRERKTVVELGCGLGLAGIAAGIGGADVLMTDYSEEALVYAERNWRRNVGTEPETLLLDWRDPPRDLQADVLLAADVAYEKRFFEPLIRTFRAMLKPGGRVLLTEPGRPLAREFFPRLEEAGFAWNRTTVKVSLNDREHEVGLYEITRSS
jgi:predicted nicotinamide N-methyase